MQIWVDADACPRPVKEVLYRCAERTQTQVVLVANAYLPVPPSAYIRSLQVPSGFDVADNKIVELMVAKDLVITSDIPLADEVISKGGVAINPRGTQYSKENIKDHLQRRDMREELRDLGVVSGWPTAYGKREVQAFSNALDRYVTRHKAQ